MTVVRFFVPFPLINNLIVLLLISSFNWWHYEPNDWIQCNLHRRNNIHNNLCFNFVASVNVLNYRISYYNKLNHTFII